MASCVVIPVILCGGAGSRLWPLSTPHKPKPFHRLFGRFSLLQETWLRCRHPLFDSCPIVVAAEAHQHLVRQQAQETHQVIDLLLEPAPRDSLAAALAGALHARQRREDCLVMILAADHYMPNPSGFIAAVERGVSAAMDGRIVTFGITPDQPLDCYGYINPGPLRSAGLHDVAHFTEKPSPELATVFIAKGYLWNSGNFLSKADRLIEESLKHCHSVAMAMQASYANRRNCRGDLLLAQADSAAISIDRAVMQHTDTASVLPVDMEWSDVGSWPVIDGLLAKQAKAGRETDVLPTGNESPGQVKRHVLDDSNSAFSILPCEQDRFVIVTSGNACLRLVDREVLLGPLQSRLIPSGTGGLVVGNGPHPVCLLEVIADTCATPHGKVGDC